MEPIKPSLHLLTIWRLRLLFCTLAPAFLSAYFFANRSVLWVLFTILWLLLFLYLYIFYYPIKWKKLLLNFNKKCLLLHCGVIYTRVKAIPYHSILYVVASSTPLSRFFGLQSLIFHMAGISTYMPGLTFDQVTAFQAYLRTQPSEEGDINEE